MPRKKPKKPFPSLAEGMSQRTLIMDATVLGALEDYCHSQVPRIRRNMLLQEISVAFLTGKGYWPPKAKEGK